jgi:Amt family ammonium transporter
MILTGAFADADVVGLDGYSTLPERSRGARVGFQIADALAGFSYTFCMTLVILYCLKAVRAMARGKWSAGFKKPAKSGGMRLVAAPQHEWLNLTPKRLSGRRTPVPPVAPPQQHPQAGPSNLAT